MKKLDILALTVMFVVLRRCLPKKAVITISVLAAYSFLKRRLRERRLSSLRGKGKVLIIGAGAAGLCAAVQLQEMGLEITVIERHTKVGGVWEANKYPGCCADVESYLYQFSFFPRAFTRKWASRDELQQYLSDLATSFNLNNSIRFNQNVDKATWNPTTNMWEVTVTDTLTGKSHLHHVNYLISAAGMLRDPKYPSFPTQDFKGQAIHTAVWDPAVSLKDKNVAIIGTGSSGIQAASVIVKDVSKLTIYIRTPPYVAPKVNNQTTSLGRFLYENSDLYMWVKRSARTIFLDTLMRLVFSNRFPSIRQLVTTIMFNSKTRNKIQKLTSGRDEEDRMRKLIPTYPLGCRRICVDNDWIETACSDKTEIVEEKVECLTKTGVKTAIKCREHDVVVFATGFYNQRYFFPVDIIGQNGLRMSECWNYDDENGSSSPYSYLGITVPEFPNFFILNGPSTNPFNSIWLTIESQVSHIKLLISHLSNHKMSSCQPTHSAADYYADRLLSDFDSTVFSDRRCNSVYHANGWPGSWCQTFAAYDDLLMTLKYGDWLFE
eukprot:TRINITY_DN13673_c0_g1_i2.p1 TRINITY_DN13673_c0_g1~~TRINITY_DN13673_c0_g1_i2.p1  ORF type:complete len:549 (+),score=61.92 TRINITY_DN13673_c0_g1_i2:128-1774(+)